MFHLSHAAALLGFGIQAALAAFSIVNSGGFLTVDTESAAGFKFVVKYSNCDLTSLVYQGLEYQYPSEPSQFNSGLGTTSTSYSSMGNMWIWITCKSGFVTQTYAARKGDSAVYMSTYVTQRSLDEVRFIARLNKSLLPVGDPEAYTDLGTTAIEGSEVFKDSAGKTYSRYYSGVRFIDDQVHSLASASGDVHVSMVKPGNAYEYSSGGPFFRDINSDRNTAYHGLYFYMFSGNAQTESQRTGFHGPYALVFSQSTLPPADLDLSFFSLLSLNGFMANTGRGLVTGSVFDLANTYERVVHWYNAGSQYWTYAKPDGTFTSPYMRPGQYTMSLYRDERLVSTQWVDVAAGVTEPMDIWAETELGTPVWTIGEFDGQPQGFQNAALQEHMHPSDSRMSAWTPTAFTVGSSALSTFPMAQIRGMNNPTTITFNLASPLATATLKIGMLFTWGGGRPQVTINNSWTIASVPTLVDSSSPGFTRGVYQGKYVLFKLKVDSPVLVAGTNTIQISCLGGSPGNMGFLNPHWIYDAVSLTPGFV